MDQQVKVLAAKMDDLNLDPHGVRQELTSPKSHTHTLDK